MAELRRKKKTASPTQELFTAVMNKLERIDDRLQSIETQQTLTEAAWKRQGNLLETINTRCMEKLGIKCPLLEDDENGNGDSREEVGCDVDSSYTGRR
jgi:hypothetical protein